jgi:hypothetical protein
MPAGASRLGDAALSRVICRTWREQKTPPVKVAQRCSLGERHSRNYFMVGMANSAPLRIPVGQRVVTAFMRV